MIKKLGFVAIFIIGLIFVYNLFGQILTTLKSGDRLQDATERLHKVELENKQLQKRLEEVSSPRFIEEQARNKLGLAKEGETVIIIPQEKIDQIITSSKFQEEERLPNWQGWLRLFWH